MTMTTEQAAQRQAEHENLLAEAIKLLKIVRNDYNSTHSHGIGWVEQVDKLLDQHSAQQ